MAILGRRSGKTTTAVERLYNSCWTNPRPSEWPLAYIAPTYKQAKRIAWNRFKQHFCKGEAQFKESELTIIHKPTGSQIYLLGCDTNAETIRGIGLWDAVVDELKDVSKQFLTEILRPCFSDTGGGCLFIGTPPRTKGISYYYYLRGSDPQQSDWKSWNATSLEAGLIPPEEIESAKKELDPDTFNREYGAAFDFIQGLVVKYFSAENIQPVEFTPGHKLHITCDFNVDPCMWLVAQKLSERVDDNTVNRYHFIDEIVRENTTVNEMVDEFVRRYPPDKYPLGITINGDASGNNRNVNTEKAQQTSYVLMRNRLIDLGYHPSKVQIAVRSKNPPIMDRIEAFNSKVMTADGRVFVYINPRCKWFIHNLENLAWIEGDEQNRIKLPSSKDIEKDRELKFIGHIFDAGSYMVEYYDPIRPERQPDEVDEDSPELIFEV